MQIWGDVGNLEEGAEEIAEAESGCLKPHPPSILTGFLDNAPRQNAVRWASAFCSSPAVDAAAPGTSLITVQFLADGIHLKHFLGLPACSKDSVLL